MTRFFRIEHNGDPRHVIDEDGRWRLPEGDLVDRYQPGDPDPVERSSSSSAAKGPAVEGSVNGTRRQASSTRELIFGLQRLVALISSVTTLLPGDIVSTGTPAGIGPPSAGDTVTVTVEGVGELTNPVTGMAYARAAALDSASTRLDIQPRIRGW